MKRKSLNSIVGMISIAALGTFPLIAQDAKDEAMTGHDQMAAMNESHEGYQKLIALITPIGDSNVKGTVVFEKEADGVRITANVGGFEPNTKHGFHVHEFGDLGAADATSAGGHFNPDGHDHGLLDKDDRHAGDMGNLEADENGKATLSLLMKGLKLEAGHDGILGRSVIIHADEDDGGQPTGNAGDRIGAGVIGISKDALAKPDDAEAKSETKMEKLVPAKPTSENDSAE